VAVLGAHWSLLLLLVLGVGALGLAVAGADEVYESVVAADDLATLDRPALDLALQQRSPRLDAVITVYTDLGGPVVAPVLTALLVVGLAVLWRSWTPVVMMVVATAGSLALTSVGKVVVGRERPPTDLAVPPFETSAAFPSGHALNATVIAGVIAYLVLLRVRSPGLRALVVVAAVAHPVLMGLSRVYLATTGSPTSWSRGASGSAGLRSSSPCTSCCCAGSGTTTRTAGRSSRPHAEPARPGTRLLLRTPGGRGARGAAHEVPGASP